MIVSIETERGALLNIVAELYAHGRIDEAAMSRLMEGIGAAVDLEGLAALARLTPLGDLPGLALRTSLVETSPQRLQGQGSVVHKKGEWIESRHIDIVGSGSSFRLDLRGYAAREGIALDLVFDLRQSSVIAILPASFRVVDGIEESRASVVKTAGKPASGAANAINLRGRIAGSFVKLVYRRG